MKGAGLIALASPVEAALRVTVFMIALFNRLNRDGKGKPPPKSMASRSRWTLGRKSHEHPRAPHDGGDAHQMRLTAAHGPAVEDFSRLAFERDPLLWVEIEVEFARG
jgi:hypothetical protein